MVPNNPEFSPCFPVGFLMVEEWLLLAGFFLKDFAVFSSLENSSQSTFFRKNDFQRFHLIIQDGSVHMDIPLVSKFLYC